MIKPTTGKPMKNSALTEEEHLTLIEGMKYASRQLLNARQYLPVKKVPANKWTARVWTGTDMGEPRVDLVMPTDVDDMVDVTYSDSPLVCIAKGFNAVGANDSAEFIQRNANNCAVQIAEKENELITTRVFLTTVTTGTIAGMLSSANNSVTSAYDFGVAGSAITGVAAGLALLRTDNIMGPYNLALNPTQYGELSADVYTGGVFGWDKVRSMLGGEIFVNSNMTAGSGMIWQRSPAYAELVVSQEITQKSDEDRMGKHFYIYQVERPLFYDTNSICLLNKI